MWPHVAIAIGLIVPILGQRFPSRQLQDTHEESFQGYGPTQPRPSRSYAAPNHPPYGPAIRLPAADPKSPPSHNCPVCPPIANYRVSCVETDPLCCLSEFFISEIEGVFPYRDTTCPNTPGISAQAVCSAIEGDRDKLDQRARLKSAGQIQTTADWVSDRYAAIAIIGSAGMCFNVYPRVKPGDVLDTSCQNTVLNNPMEALSNIAQGTSIATGGNLVIQTPAGGPMGASFQGAVIVLGDFTVLETPDSEAIMMAASNVFTGPDAFNGVGALFGGAITFDQSITGPEIAVTTGGMAATFVSSNTFTSLFTSGATVISSNAIAQFKEEFDIYLCSAFNQILALSDNGEAEYGLTGEDLDLNCNGLGTGLCIITTTAAELRDVTLLSVLLDNYSSAIVKVTGGGSQYFQSPDCNGDCSDILFVFVEAESITLSVDSPTAGPTAIFPIFAPVATAVNLMFDGTTTLEDSGIIAPSGSTITLTNSIQIEALDSNNEIWTLPSQSVFNIIFCDCLCDPGNLPFWTEDRECLRSLYGYDRPYHRRY